MKDIQIFHRIPTCMQIPCVRSSSETPTPEAVVQIPESSNSKGVGVYNTTASLPLPLTLSTYS